MEIRTGVLLIVLGGALVTVLPRVLPLVVLARFDLPRWARTWLSYVPISVLAALLAAELALDHGHIVFKPREIIAILPALAVAALARSLIGAVIAGVAAIALLRLIA